MNFLRDKFIELFEFIKVKDYLVEILADVSLLVILVILAFVVYFTFKLIYSLTLKKISGKTKNVFIGEFFKSPLILTIFKVATIFVISLFTKSLVSISDILSTVISIVIIFLIVKVINAVLDLVNSVYEQHNNQAGARPIKGLINFAKGIIFIIAFILVISDLVGQSPLAILTGLGAMSAVLMLVFKDTILGLVAGFQMSSNDLIRIGDWIEMPKYGVDGNVIDVTLTFIKVENWDKTIVTIPAYLIISDSFTNWRNVFQKGGRRIKRSINIDSSSVKVIDEQLFNKLIKVDLIKDYLTNKKEEIDLSNKDVDTSVSLNGRRLTNLGVFRVYINEYLKQNPNIHKEMLMIVRQLQYENKGIPLEIYAFSSNTAWVHYEGIQADIFDHLYANIGYFDLKLFQEPTGSDFLKGFKEN